MRVLHESLLSLFVLSGMLLVNGCSPNATTPNPTPQAQPSPGTRSQGGESGGGAIQAVRGAVKRVPDENELKNFPLAYTQHALANRDRGPSNVQELRDSLTPKMVKDFQSDGPYVVNWGLKNPSSNSILAYSKDVDMYGLRMVARGDGAVVRMNKQEFEQAKTRR
jgi:hypothetical protein